jgi:hypothetical protein
MVYTAETAGNSLSSVVAPRGPEGGIAGGRDRHFGLDGSPVLSPRRGKYE